ncbi:Coiled-coil domain-containing protein C6orf97 [Fasciola gigantica]|uniref:Coiled-coil domain-containing protein C6orf97 n=1 Tax=Fasciola gigantica TaxID=46835 RepID=A0A504YRJ6_FASGI|nr:Coiled-coil domain-containing protein C6orf97 [Fasciola gigantica]
MRHKPHALHTGREWRLSTKLTIPLSDNSTLSADSARHLQQRVQRAHELTLSQETELNTQKALTGKLQKENQELLSKLNTAIGEQKGLTEKFTSLKSQYETREMEKQKLEKNASELKQQLEREKQKAKTLEDRIKNQAVERERAEHEMHKAEQRLEYFVSQMIRIFDKYIREDQISLDGCKDEKKLAQLVARAGQLVEENVKHRGAIQDLTDRVRERDLQLAERDRTVDRLGGQLTRTTECDRETRNLAQQLEYSRGNECMLERRVHEMTENLMRAKEQIHDLEHQLAQAQHDNEHVYEMRREMNLREVAMFRESLAAILSSSRIPCSPTEVAIKEHARRVVAECNEQRELCARMEARLVDATAKMDSMQTLQVDARDEVERVERDNVALRDQIRRLESELATSELTKGGHRADKERYFVYLCKLASKVKLDQSLAVRMDIKELQEAILVRVGQLTRGEYTLLTDLEANADRVTGLNRTIKRLQDQLASKEIQLGMWRTKSSKMDEQVAELKRQISEGQAEKMNAQRAAAGERRVEVENGRLRDELNRLRSELLELTEAKTQFIQLEERMTDLVRTNKELEEVRQNQATKIAELRKVVEQQAAELTDQQKQSTDSIQRLTDDVHSTRQTIEQLRRSEKELFEFRALIGRLLGLDVDALTVPNYDIVRKLETLIGKLRQQQQHQYNKIHDVLSDELEICSRTRSPSRRITSELNSSGHGTYLAGPGIAMARSKEARYGGREKDMPTRSAPSTEPFDKSRLQMNPAQQHKDQNKTPSPEQVRRDPRRY